MDYRKLIEKIYTYRFERQYKERILQKIISMQVEIYEEGHAVINRSDNEKYLRMYLELIKKLNSKEFDNKKLDYVRIRKIIDKIRDKYRNFNTESQENVFLRNVKEIVECGLYLSNNEKEMEYLQLLNKEFERYSV